MKHIFDSLCMAFLTLLCSCSSSLPGLYDEEIQDNVKYRIAFADYLVEEADNLYTTLGVLGSDEFEKNIDQMEEVFNEMYVKTDLTYKQVLQKVATNNKSKYKKIAQGILKNYNELNISLSDYVESSTRNNYKSWKFSELHSGIEFLFEVENWKSDKPIWFCTPIEKSYTDYLERQLE
ncbi:MAG: hypothetical protein NC410_11680 [Oscillibacter sp.]|nr:hypothetical protein [Oscillibacter sp.]